jgi:RNA polymerase sigma factor (sigma-70 family)
MLMATGSIDRVLLDLRNLALRWDQRALTDGALLGRFVNRRDPAALEVLIERHAGMVWAVCRRILTTHHDVEDAFQATFLVLVRRAAVIRPREMVSNWLYGVARQTALKARATTAKRHARERQVTTMPEPQAVDRASAGPDLLCLLDEELSRLPDKYRVAIVLCDLEGKTRREAARQLGVPDGTVGARLARARTMLARRLTRRGLTVTGGTLSAALAQQAASGAAPITLVSATTHAATLVAAGEGTAACAISGNVVAIAETVLKAMLLSKIKVLAIGLAVTALACLAGAIYYARTAGSAAEPPNVRGRAGLPAPNQLPEPRAGALSPAPTAVRVERTPQAPTAEPHVLAERRLGTPRSMQADVHATQCGELDCIIVVLPSSAPGNATTRVWLLVRASTTTACESRKLAWTAYTLNLDDVKSIQRALSGKREIPSSKPETNPKIKTAPGSEA